MTLQELKGLIDYRYTRESAKLGQEQKRVEAGEFTLFYEIVLQEILEELSLNESTQEIAISAVTVFTEYALNGGYSALRNYQLIFTGEDATSPMLELTPMDEMPTAGVLVAGTPNRISIYPKDDGLYYVYLHPLSAYAGTLTIRYKTITAITAGGGNDASLTGSVPLNTKYNNLIQLGILSMLMPEFQAEYMARLDHFKGGHDATPTKGNIDYSLGGF